MKKTKNMVGTPKQINKISKKVSVSEKLEAIQNELIEKLGSLLHEEWRAPRKQKDGSFEARIKKTKDESWISIHKISEVDIANTLYIDLPEDRKYENKASAEVAIKEIYKAVKDWKALDTEWIEAASDVIHQEWLKRNTWVYDPTYGNPLLAKPYTDLPEEEKEKDRTIIRKAIEMCHQVMHQ